MQLTSQWLRKWMLDFRSPHSLACGYMHRKLCLSDRSFLLSGPISDRLNRHTLVLGRQTN